MPVPETDIDRQLYALSDDRSPLSPNRMRQWNKSPALSAPAEACRTALVLAREEVNNALERQHYHAGPQPEALLYWWTRVQNSVERARQQALAAENLCAPSRSAEPGDIYQDSYSQEVWGSMAAALAAAHAEARVQRAYWQGVMDAAPTPE